MELFQITHLPMPIMGGLLFVIGLLSLRVAKHAVQGPLSPHWLRHDMACLLLGTALTLPLGLGLGFMLTALISTLMGQGGPLVELLVMAVIVGGGWILAGRTKTGAEPAQV